MESGIYVYKLRRNFSETESPGVKHVKKNKKKTTKTTHSSVKVAVTNALKMIK